MRDEDWDVVLFNLLAWIACVAIFAIILVGMTAVN